MFYSRKNIEKFCRTLIESMVKEVASESKVLLEEHWDRRLGTLAEFQKTVNAEVTRRLSDLQDKIDAGQDDLQHRVDMAVEKLTKLATDLVKVSEPAQEEVLKSARDGEKRRVAMMEAQAKESAEYRSRGYKHMDTIEDFNEKAVASWDRVADGIEKMADMIKNLDPVLENLTGAIDDFKKPAPKPKKKG